MALGRYADGGTYSLPETIDPVDDALLDRALYRAQDALAGPRAAEAIRRYYDVDTDFAGTSFCDIEPNDPVSIGPADLLAVTRLSMTITNRQSRRLLTPGDARRDTANSLLASVPDHLDLATDLSAEVLTSMQRLYEHLRTIVSASSNRWVFAAKLCARKRPRLFPVRDNKVCGFLGGEPIGGGTHRMGWFASDIQVLAFLISHPDIRRQLTELRDSVAADGVAVDAVDLRLLDAAVWMRAVHG
jgi:hypothetical protein